MKRLFALFRRGQARWVANGQFFETQDFVQHDDPLVRCLREAGL